MNRLPNWQVKGNGPTITTPIHNERDWNTAGQGNNLASQTYTGFNKASIDDGNAVAENITVHYISENTGKEIQAPTNYTGHANDSIHNQTLDDIANLEKAGYTFDQGATLGQRPKVALPANTFDPQTQNFTLSKDNVNVYNAPYLAFDNDKEPNNQIYYAYFYQDSIPTSRTITAHETINYIYGNGPHAGEVAQKPVIKELTFTTQGIVTNGITSWNSNWTNDKNEFAFSAVKTPEIIKYIPSQGQITQIKLDDQTLTNAANKKQGLNYSYTVVYYTTEHALVSFYDDTDQTSLTNYLTKNGQKVAVTDSYQKQDNNSTKTAITFEDADEIVNFLSQKGLKFSKVTGTGSNNATNYAQVSYGNFDNNPDHDQTFVLHFVHGKTTSSEAKTINEKVVYYYENGPYAGEVIKIGQVTPVTFTRKASKDLFTGQINYGDWSNGSLPAIQLAQTVTGKNGKQGLYVIDSNKITQTPSNFTKVQNYEVASVPFTQNQINKLENGASFEIKVPYKLHENITIKYIDDTDHNTLKTDKLLIGEPKENAKYSTISSIKEYEDQGYKLVSDQTGQKELFFDNDEDPNDQNYEVHLIHNTTPIKQTKTVYETIEYFYANGPKKGQTAAPTYQAKEITFVQKGVKDLVTKQVKWNSWTPSASQFKEVISPKIGHYTADQMQIEAQKVDHNSSDLIFKVYYSTISEPTKPVEPQKPNKSTKPTKSTTSNKPQPTKPTKPNKQDVPQIPSSFEFNNIPHSQQANEELISSVPVSHAKTTPSTIKATTKQNNLKLTLHNNLTLTIHPHFTTTSETTPKATTSHNTHQSKQKLPATGQKKNSLGLICLALVSTAGIFGLSSKKRKN